MNRQNDATITTSNIPSPGDPDRKRVLNVLAQRRYRQRKRERLAELEARAASANRNPQSKVSSAVPNAGPFPPDHFLSSRASIQNRAGPEPLANNGAIDVAPDALFTVPSMPESYTRTTESDIITLETVPSGGSPDSFLSLSFAATNDEFSHDINFFLHQTTPPSSSEEAEDNNTTLPQQIGRFSPNVTTVSPDMILDVPVLKTLQAGLLIARLLGCENTLFDPFYRRTLGPSAVPDLSLIPSNLMPTEAQQRIPHHPIIDVLPWASVRTKLICIFAMPPQMRPASARDPLAVMQIVYDMDDMQEGCRIVGESGLKEEDWEVGEAFLRNWWWALDRKVIENTNKLRLKRGAKRLMIDATDTVF